MTPTQTTACPWMSSSYFSRMWETISPRCQRLHRLQLSRVNIWVKSCIKLRALLLDNMLLWRTSKSPLRSNISISGLLHTSEMRRYLTSESNHSWAAWWRCMRGGVFTGMSKSVQGHGRCWWSIGLLGAKKSYPVFFITNLIYAGASGDVICRGYNREVARDAATI